VCKKFKEDIFLFYMKRSISEKVANGYLIKIGCKEFIAKTWEEISKEISEYWIDPKAAEKKYTTETV